MHLLDVQIQNKLEQRDGQLTPCQICKEEQKEEVNKEVNKECKEFYVFIPSHYKCRGLTRLEGKLKASSGRLRHPIILIVTIYFTTLGKHANFILYRVVPNGPEQKLNSGWCDYDVPSN